MNEYHINLKKDAADIEEIAKLNESVLNENAYASNMNVDNFPTHRSTTEVDEEGNPLEYCAASKNFAKVDPTNTDTRTIHYAPEDRTYLIFRNKYTGKWEFPTAPMMLGQSFQRGRQNLFIKYSKNAWRIRMFGQIPLITTLRDLTQAEKDDDMNQGLKGVRTYFFGAHHHYGLPSFDFENEEIHHDDFAWIPKRQLNEWFTKEYYDIFIDATKTR